MKLQHLTSLAAALAASIAPALANDWNAPQAPFALYGNTYYVGTHGLSSVLITSPAGHILIDGGSPESAAHIASHIRQLGFNIKDVKTILNSHEHFDHAGGIAELQRLSGATVLSSPAGAAVLRTGLPNKDDPQYKDGPSGIAPVARVGLVADGAVVSVGALRVTAHYTPGHTPGGISWTWDSSEGGVAAHMVYADSLNAFTTKPFQYRTHPQARNNLTRSIATVAALPCDILVSAHPESSDLWERLQKAEKQGHTGFIDRAACRAYAADASARLASTLATEGGKP
jgi:metallo-beta-lactamase class B